MAADTPMNLEPATSVTSEGGVKFQKICNVNPTMQP